jgi:predicted amidohydrolase YtcJ
MGVAYAGRRKDGGSIENGKLADMIVVNRTCLRPIRIGSTRLR